jgi:hypothetical protein
MVLNNLLNLKNKKKYMEKLEVVEVKSFISKELVDSFISKVEKTLDDTLKIWGFKNLTEKVANTVDSQKTVEKTKLVSNFYEKCFKDTCKEFGLEINEVSSNGYDIKIDNDEYEIKLTLSQGDTWTGNCYSNIKVKKLILIKLDFDDNNKVTKVFFGILNSNNSTWTGQSKSGKSGFSAFNINKSDISNLDIIYGNVKPKDIYLKIETQSI